MIDLQPACDAMAAVVSGTDDGQLDGPTPCPDLTVGDLVSHVDLVAQGATALALGSTQLPTAGTPTTGPWWRAAVTDHLGALGRAWDDPGAWTGPGGVPGSDLPRPVWGRITLTELVVHGWDLATATGQAFSLPPATLEACLAHVEAFVPTAPVPGLWGPPVAVPADAPALDRILGITGRTP